jgi:hypothetical protein
MASIYVNRVTDDVRAVSGQERFAKWSSHRIRSLPKPSRENTSKSVSQHVMLATGCHREQSHRCEALPAISAALATVSDQR